MIEELSIIRERFPHVANKIELFWGHPEIDLVFEDLIYDKRGGRQGFPPEVMSAIMRLFKKNGEETKKPHDVWLLNHYK